MSATGAERLTLCGRLAGVRVSGFNPRGTLNSSESLLYNLDGGQLRLVRLYRGVLVRCVP
jgi:hypothetical protein